MNEGECRIVKKYCIVKWGSENPGSTYGQSSGMNECEIAAWICNKAGYSSKEEALLAFQNTSLNDFLIMYNRHINNIRLAQRTSLLKTGLLPEYLPSYCIDNLTRSQTDIEGLAMWKGRYPSGWGVEEEDIAAITTPLVLPGEHIERGFITAEDAETVYGMPIEVYEEIQIIGAVISPEGEIMTREERELEPLTGISGVREEIQKDSRFKDIPIKIIIGFAVVLMAIYVLLRKRK